MNSSRASQLISSYSDQLNSRFHSNSIALEVLICLVFILILVIEIVKFGKKTYEWQTEFQINLELKYGTNQSKYTMVSREQVGEDNNQRDAKQNTKIEGEEEKNDPPASRRSTKREVYLPPVIRIEEIIKNKMPQLAILVVNIAMLSSYEFLNISGYITIVLIIITEILGLKETEHLNLRFVLEILIKLLMIAWYINIFTVPKPSPN